MDEVAPPAKKRKVAREAEEEADAASDVPMNDVVTHAASPPGNSSDRYAQTIGYNDSADKPVEGQFPICTGHPQHKPNSRLSY